VKQKDYYKILGIEKDATHQQIKEAYRKLAFEFHPDRNKGDLSAVEKMKELNEAYAVLSDPGKKRRYDSINQQYGYDAYEHFRQGYSDQDIFRGSDINQIFEEMTRQFGFRSFNDLFREFYGPGYQTFEFRRPGVFGRGYIFTNFPFGRHGSQGAPSSIRTGFVTGLLGKLAGYLAKKAFTGWDAGQHAADRYDVITLSQEDARRGGKVSYVDRTTSRQLIVTVPVGVREGQTIRLKGAANVNGDRSQGGDLYLRVQFRKGFFQLAKELYNKILSK
jgi:DnaJ-class molecular chaperone